MMKETLLFERGNLTITLTEGGWPWLHVHDMEDLYETDSIGIHDLDFATALRDSLNKLIQLYENIS